MASPMILKTDTRAFMAAVEKRLAASKRSRPAFMRSQAKLILGQVVAITPPAGHNEDTGETVLGVKAKQAGEKVVAANIRKIMTGQSNFAKGQNGRYRIDIPSLHRRYRNSDGRVTKSLNVGGRGGDHRYRVPREALAAYIKAKQKLVGFLASGWCAAATEFKLSLPAWITRNNAPGAATVAVTDRGIVVTATNGCRFAGNVKDMQRRINYALQIQTGKIERQIKDYEEKLNREARLA